MSSMVKILATADWQIGKAFGNIGHASDTFREQLFITAEYIIREVSKDYDLVLILGDTFDRSDADWSLIKRMSELLRSSDKPIHIISGNHDYFHSGGVISALKNELEDADHIIIHTEQEPHHIKSLNLTLYPGVLRSNPDFTDRVNWIPKRKKSDGLRIGMFHESIQPHGDFDPEVSLNHDLDMTLLGDHHGPAGNIENSLIDQPSRKLWYAGSPEAQNIKHNWQGRVLGIEVEIGKEIIVEPIYVGKLKFEDVIFNFKEDMDSPLELLSEKLGDIVGEQKLTYVRLCLTGEGKPETHEGLEDLLKEFKGNWPNNSVIKEQFSVINDYTDSDKNLQEISEELSTMNLTDEVLARSIILLRRYYRGIS